MSYKEEVLDSMPVFLMDFLALSKLMNRIEFNGTCWEVKPDGNQHKGPTGTIRYPRVWHPSLREKILAHRFMLAAFSGTTFESLPKGLVVMHLCDNPNCIFPGHLKLGTQSENMTHAWQRKGSLRQPTHYANGRFAKTPSKR